MENLSIIDLPEDALLAIFAQCDYKTLLIIAQVCKTFNRLASQDVLWRRISERCLNIRSKHKRQAFTHSYVNNLKSLQILYNILRPTYRIRLVVCDSYHGVCNRVNVCNAWINSCGYHPPPPGQYPRDLYFFCKNVVNSPPPGL